MVTGTVKRVKPQLALDFDFGLTQQAITDKLQVLPELVKLAKTSKNLPGPQPRFDVRRDKAIINAGGFFCGACLLGKPADERSPDGRYCQGCYSFLEGEVMLLLEGRKPRWLPQPLTARNRGEKGLHGGTHAITKT